MQRRTRIGGKGGRVAAAKASAHRRSSSATWARGQGEDCVIAVYLSASSTSSSAVKTVKTSSSSSSSSESSNNNDRVDAPDVYDCGLRAGRRRCGRHHRVLCSAAAVSKKKRAFCVGCVCVCARARVLRQRAAASAARAIKKKGYKGHDCHQLLLTTNKPPPPPLPY
jgi:hypothetical protein